ncbi:MAG: hypothetical protein GXO96_04040 [Nitrospirae bacterium]|nr:hypothetical protein [Candidatus Manganitrophaceae bacterium]
MKNPAAEKPPKATRIPIDRARFLEKTNTSLKKIERTSLLILLVISLGGWFFSKETGLSLLIGGFLAMLHFRSLHRMFQKRILFPKQWLKTKFIYSVGLFFILCFFFWVIQWEGITRSGIITGFLLSTGAIFWESTRKR